MNLENEKLKAKSTMNNGRFLIVVTALPIIGTLVKFFYGDETASQELETQNSIEVLINSFPSINLNELFTLDHFIVLGFTFGLVMGVLTLKRGISQMIELDSK